MRDLAYGAVSGAIIFAFILMLTMDMYVSSFFLFLALVLSIYLWRSEEA